MYTIRSASSAQIYPIHEPNAKVGTEKECGQIDLIRDKSENPLENCTDLDAVRTTLTGCTAEFGLPFYSYLLLRPPRGASGTSADRIVTNYVPEWIERYERKLYKYYDPVALVASGSRLPFFWDSKNFLRSFRKDQRRVFHEGRTFNIACGYSIPIFGPAGDVGVFSLVASRESHLTDAVRGAGSEVYLTALQTHDRIVRLGAEHRETDEDVTLSAREIECLKWTSDGLTTDAIAETISISPATVNYHINKSIRKLDATNRHHAAIKAIRAGLI